MSDTEELNAILADMEEEPIVRADLRTLLTEETEAPPPPVYRYRVSIPLPPALDEQVSAARSHAALGAAEMGFFALQTDFRTANLELVQTTLQAWAAEHLPLGLTVERVEAAVEGSQHYLAGYALEPMLKLTKAQQALVEALAPHIENLSPTASFAPRVLVGEGVPAPQFPKLIHFMQQQFKALNWTLRQVELLHAPEDDLRWEVLATV